VTTKKTGVGLGLSIVSKIVDGHGGSIHVENAPGGGAVFTLFFPLEGNVGLAEGDLRSAGHVRAPFDELRAGSAPT
jgi:K+-sensing histidine kinase KdpD